MGSKHGSEGIWISAGADGVPADFDELPSTSSGLEPVESSRVVEPKLEDGFETGSR